MEFQIRLACIASVSPQVIGQNLEKELCQRARTEMLARQTKIKQVSRALFSGCIHTSQNGALFTLWVPKLSFVHFAPSADDIFAKEV